MKPEKKSYSRGFVYIRYGIVRKNVTNVRNDDERENKKEENSKIIKRWELKVDDFERHFSELLNVSEISEKYDLIQKYVNNKIKEMIQINTNIKELVFTGKGVFESPYCADFSYISGELDKYAYSDFIVTQGSNRQVQPTIVIKPR